MGSNGDICIAVAVDISGRGNHGAEPVILNARGEDSELPYIATSLEQICSAVQGVGMVPRGACYDVMAAVAIHVSRRSNGVPQVVPRPGASEFLSAGGRQILPAEQDEYPPASVP